VDGAGTDMSTNDVIGPNESTTEAAGPKRGSSHRTTRLRRSDDETGALLILALIFITVISVVGSSLTLWATNNLNNTSKFASALATESATNSAVQLALQDVRYNFTPSTLNTSPPQPCWIPQLPAAPVAEQTFNGQNVAVWCSTQWNPMSAATRVVTFTACLEPNFANGTLSTVIDTAATACALNPFLQAVVQFDDFPSTISASNCSPLASTTCGTTFTVLSWAFGVTIPSITTFAASLSTTATCTTTREIDITGAQLTGATSVNFVQSSANNVVLSFTNNAVLSGGTATSLTACATSQMIAGKTYQVSVTTPSGTSATVSLPF
jgi:hypothetical protein